MTAQELHQLTAPLFEKHPKANPDGLFYHFLKSQGGGDWYLEPYDDSIVADHAALIIQGHLVEWLAGNTFCRHLSISAPDGETVFWYVEGKRGETLLHSLVSACMEVPCSH